MSTVIVHLCNKTQSEITGIDFNFKDFAAVTLNVAPEETKKIDIPLRSISDNLYISSYWTIYFNNSTATPVMIRNAGRHIFMDVDMQNLIWNKQSISM